MTDNLSQYLSVLNQEQRAAVEHEGSPLLILAGAGSGKTRVITTKIAWLIGEKNIDPWSILAVTFTKKAANEMRERAVSLDERASSAQIRTFHSFGSWFLRKFADKAGLDKNFTVYDDGDMETIVKKAVPSLSSKEAKIVAHQISLAKDYCLFPEDDLSQIGSEFDLNEIYKKYQERLRATGNADFGDLIMLPGRIIDENPQVADYVHSRFGVIMVDEYQDSNIAQFKLLQKLSGWNQTEGGTSRGNYVCVVGDDDQSIYHFRGAEVQNILSFEKHFPGTQIIRLERNYRSTAKILNAADLVVKKNVNRLGKTLIADRGDGNQPVLAFLPDQNAEAVFTSGLIQKSVSDENHPSKYSDWAVLYRTNAQSLNFEKEFLHKKIPYVVVGSLKFYEREEIKDALSYIALCANPRDEISFRRVVNKPSRGLGEKTQDKILENAVEWQADGSLLYSNLIEACRTSAPNLSKKAREGAEAFCKIFSELDGYLSPSESEDKKDRHLSDFIERVIKTSGLDEYHKASDEIEGTQRLQNLEELVNSAIPYDCSIEGLTDFLDAINLDRSLELSQEEKSDDAVTLITLHNTKGLEYKKVVITGLEEGIFPRMDKAGADLEEERRLFYVGIPRARDELYVTSCASRYMYGNIQFMRPSPFIKDGASAFTMIGQVPYSMKKAEAEERLMGMGKRIEGSPFDSSRLNDDGENGLSEEDLELLDKYKKGTRVFHDDYGYGMIQKCFENEGEIVAEIIFESGGKKKFLPKYQRKSLEIIRD